MVIAFFFFSAFFILQPTKPASEQVPAGDYFSMLSGASAPVVEARQTPNYDITTK